MFRAASFLLSFTFLASCATLGMRRGVSKNDLSKMKKVAVYSALGHELNHTYIGTTIYQNRQERIDVAPWATDQLIVSKMIEGLKTNPQFRQVDAFRTALTPEDLYGKDGVKKLLAAAKQQGYDMLVAIWPSAYNNAPAFPPGFGVLQQSLFGTHHTAAYVAAVARAYDVNSESDLAWQWTFDSFSGKPAMTSKEVVPWKDKYADYTDAEKAQIQKALSAQLTTAVEYSLHALNLVR